MLVSEILFEKDIVKKSNNSDSDSTTPPEIGKIGKGSKVVGNVVPDPVEPDAKPTVWSNAKSKFKAVFGALRRVATFKFNVLIGLILGANNLYRSAKEYGIILQMNNCSRRVQPGHSAEFNGNIFSSEDLVKRLNHRAYKIKSGVVMELVKAFGAAAGADQLMKYMPSLVKVPGLNGLFAVGSAATTREGIEEIIKAIGPRAQELAWLVSDYIVGDWLSNYTLQIASDCGKVSESQFTFGKGSLSSKDASQSQKAKKIKALVDEILRDNPQLAVK